MMPNIGRVPGLSAPGRMNFRALPSSCWTSDLLSTRRKERPRRARGTSSASPSCLQMPPIAGAHAGTRASRMNFRAILPSDARFAAHERKERPTPGRDFCVLPPSCFNKAPNRIGACRLKRAGLWSADPSRPRDWLPRAAHMCARAAPVQTVSGQRCSIDVWK
jgi:hypothetical protein